MPANEFLHKDLDKDGKVRILWIVPALVCARRYIRHSQYLDWDKEVTGNSSTN